MKNKIKKPSLFLHLTEGLRAVWELIKGIFFLRNFQYQNMGKGQPVLVLPGLLSTDLATALLRKFLQRLGYQAYGWGMGRNLGHLDKIPIIVQKVEKIAIAHQQKIILIGWSMGGIFAREVAKTTPDSIKKVITMGSPFADVQAPNYANWVFDLLNRNVVIDPNQLNQVPNPAPVPTLAIYSKLDGIVPWQACMELNPSETHKNIEASSSHFGMGANPEILKILFSEINT